METAVCVENLQKRYGDTLVLKGISFSVEKGEVFALLGANGAGKTTTLECLEGVRRYDNGTIRLSGDIGVQLQSTSLPRGIRVGEALRFFARWGKTEVDWAFAARLGLEEIKNKSYDALSTGQKRRLHLALAMLKNPEILVLDEPTAGLDVEGRAALHDEIRRLKEEGKTILLASHDMAEVESLCSRLAVLKEGKLVFTGTPDAFAGQVSTACRVRVKLSAPPKPWRFQTCSVLGEERGYWILEMEQLEEGLRELLAVVQKNGAHLYDLQMEHRSLEERFLEIAKEDIA